MKNYNYENLKKVVLNQFTSLEVCIIVNDYQNGVADEIDHYILAHKQRVIDNIFNKNQLYIIYEANLEQFEFLDKHILK